jgi:hypothetical protein
MKAISKLAIAGLVGIAAPMTLSGEALAGHYRASVYAASYRTHFAAPHYAGFHHRHHGFAPAFTRYHAGWRPYPYHTYASPYRSSYASPYRYSYGAAYGAYSPSRHYHRHYGWGARAAYASAPAYPATTVSPYFTSYSAAGTVSYPVYRVDHYMVDYSSPMVSYSSENCCW